MGRMFSLGSLLVVALIAIFAYMNFFKKTETPGSTTPLATIDSVGAKNDILAIAQGERTYQAEHGNYVSLDELNSSGELSIPKTGRAGYTYSVDVSDAGFRVTAQCSTPAGSCPSYAVDQTMEVQAIP